MYLQPRDRLAEGLRIDRLYQFYIEIDAIDFLPIRSFQNALPPNLQSQLRTSG